MKIILNKCYGGFGLSQSVYKKLIEYGVPVCHYESNQHRDDEVIFDRDLSKDARFSFDERYWDCWTREKRTHPLVIRAVEELGEEASSSALAELKIVEIPDGIEYTIEEYDGIEWVAEQHQTWR